MYMCMHVYVYVYVYVYVKDGYFDCSMQLAYIVLCYAHVVSDKHRERYMKAKERSDTMRCEVNA